MDKHLIGLFSGGVYAAMHEILQNSYVEAGLKGLIGGATGYAGTYLVGWMAKKLKSKNTKKP